MEEGRTADKHRPGANGGPCDGMPDMSADGRYSPAPAVKAHRCTATVEPSATRMTSAAPAAAREDGF